MAPFVVTALAGALVSALVLLAPAAPPWASLSMPSGWGWEAWPLVARFGGPLAMPLGALVLLALGLSALALGPRVVPLVWGAFLAPPPPPLTPEVAVVERVGPRGRLRAPAPSLGQGFSAPPP